MAHDSFFFIALTAGYVICLFFPERIIQWNPFRYGFYTYGVVIVLIAVSMIARSASVDEFDPSSLVQVEIWLGGLSWLAAGSSAVFLLASLMPRNSRRPSRKSEHARPKRRSPQAGQTFDPFDADEPSGEDASSEDRGT